MGVIPPPETIHEGLMTLPYLNPALAASILLNIPNKVVHIGLFIKFKRLAHVNLSKESGVLDA